MGDLVSWAYWIVAVLVDVVNFTIWRAALLGW